MVRSSLGRQYHDDLLRPGARIFHSDSHLRDPVLYPHILLLLFHGNSSSRIVQLRLLTVSAGKAEGRWNVTSSGIDAGR
jgi:hypothetical protein